MAGRADGWCGGGAGGDVGGGLAPGARPGWQVLTVLVPARLLWVLLAVR